MNSRSGNVENLIHKAIAKNRVSGRKEFFSIDPEQAISALQLTNGKDVTPRFQTKPTAQEDKASKIVKRTRRENTVLKDLGIRPGTTLRLARGQNITCTVVAGNKVRFEGKTLSLSAAAVKALRKLHYKTLAAAGTKYWMLDGKSVGQIREEKERR